MPTLASLPDDVMWHILSYCVPLRALRVIIPSVGFDRLRMLDMQCDWWRRYQINRQIYGIKKHFERRPHFGSYASTQWTPARAFDDIGFPRRFFMLCYPVRLISADARMGYRKIKRLPVELGHPFD